MSLLTCHLSQPAPLSLTHIRAGERKLGERVEVLNKTDWAASLAYSAAPFVFLGIAERHRRTGKWRYWRGTNGALAGITGAPKRAGRTAVARRAYSALPAFWNALLMRRKSPKTCGRRWKKLIRWWLR